MKRLDLLLVNAPARAGVYGKLSALSAIEPPVWAGLIARYCLNRGFAVEILDAESEGLDCQETANRIIAARPRLAAFCIYGHQPSASTQCLPAASLVAKIIAEQMFATDPIRTLALGTHPSALPGKTLREEPFDFVCQGEGPYTIATMLANTFIPRPGSVWSIPGLWGNALPPFGTMQNITDLDAELPSQAWELLDMKRYRAHNWHLWTATQHAVDVQVFPPTPGAFGKALSASKPLGGYVSVQTSLGCPFKCTFCCINAPFTGGGELPRLRKWSPENVAMQINKLAEEYGITNIKIPDEMFVLDRQHVRDICEHLLRLRLGDRLNMWAYARVDTVKDDELLALMRRAGFRWLGIGVESGSKHVRDGVEKGRFGNEDIAAAIGRVHNAGICVGANYIFGLPDDTPESCEETLALACELNTEWANFYCAMAYPGSALHAEAVRRGWRLPEDPGGPGWIGYSQHAYESLPLRTEAMTAEEVLDFRDEAFLRYFTRPAYLDMMQRRFGDRVVEQIERMIALGKPKRIHRDAKSAPTRNDAYDRSV